MKKWIIVGIVIVAVVASGFVILAINRPLFIPGGKDGEMMVKKPVIYLYPQDEMDIEVSLELAGEFDCTYPEYDNGWRVRAYPDGRIMNYADNQEYSYLFWDAVMDLDYDFSRGFVVRGADTAVFLQEKLKIMGLTPKEYNEFIVYWLPQMQKNEFNLISFQGEAYTDCAKLNISPEPDSVLRVFMAYKSSDEWTEIPVQQLSGFERKGFAVIEWGGAEVSEFDKI